MNFKLVLLIGLICLSNQVFTTTTVAQCLGAIEADDGHVGLYAEAPKKVDLKENKQVTSSRRLQALSDLAEDESPLTALVKSYFALSETNQEAITACNLSSKAQDRCESVHGAGNCELKGPGLYNKKCAAGLIKLGHSICATRCPEGFSDRGLDCYKPDGYKVSSYQTLTECKAAVGEEGECERYSIERYVPVCKPNFIRHGFDGCIPVCPDGWVDMGRKCLRPELDIQNKVFAWKESDEQ